MDKKINTKHNWKFYLSICIAILMICVYLPSKINVQAEQQSYSTAQTGSIENKYFRITDNGRDTDANDITTMDVDQSGNISINVQNRGG